MTGVLHASNVYPTWNIPSKESIALYLYVRSRRTLIKRLRDVFALAISMSPIPIRIGMT